jgi:hypothetical protein
LLAPELVLSLLSAEHVDVVGITVSRLLGGALLGLSLMGLAARNVTDPRGLRAVLQFLTVYIAGAWGGTSSRVCEAGNRSRVTADNARIDHALPVIPAASTQTALS